MHGNRRTDSKPEVALRAAVHRLGLRFRKDFRLDLPEHRVRPDLVFTRDKVAVFSDGCFWHSCPEHGNVPRTNPDYWEPKLARNRKRDRRNEQALRAAGWLVVRVWEHEDPTKAAERIQVAVLSRRHRP
jgi:DNA mismatch endonuclease (patch repair protein)